MDDLSLKHEPIGDLFAEARSVLPKPLTENQKSFFRENGYLAGLELLSKNQCEQLLQSLEKLTDEESVKNPLWHEVHSNESNDPNRVLFHALGAWRIDQNFHDLLWNKAFVSAASQLLDSPIRFWHDQLFCKPANHGGNVAWHQDFSYWTRTTPMQHLTCWIALEDATIQNGCIQYIPGSHHWDLLPLTDLAGDMQGIRNALSDTQWKRLQNPVPIELKQGFATFHHPLLVHGSAANDSNNSRRAAVINVFADGVKSATSEPLLDGIPVVPNGEILDGQFFPLLGD